MNTKIQTAGEQKYYDFIKAEDERLRLGMIIWISMLAAALITVFERAGVAVILGMIGVILAFINLKRHRLLKSKLDSVTDKKEFFLQLTSPDTTEIKEFHLIISKDYVLSKTADIHIYCFSDMAKVEVGVDKSTGKKVLFLTDKDGVRNEIASCVAGDQGERLVDEVGHALQMRLSGGVGEDTSSFYEE